MRERNASMTSRHSIASEAAGARDYVSSQQRPDSHCSMEGQVPGNFSVEMSLAGIEPVGFRVKSDLRNHCAIVQPRLYDSAMVTQITLGGFRPTNSSFFQLFFSTHGSQRQLGKSTPKTMPHSFSSKTVQSEFIFCWKRTRNSENNA